MIDQGICQPLPNVSLVVSKNHSKYKKQKTKKNLTFTRKFEEIWNDNSCCGKFFFLCIDPLLPMINYIVIVRNHNFYEHFNFQRTFQQNALHGKREYTYIRMSCSSSRTILNDYEPRRRKGENNSIQLASRRRLI